jgi:hypothetical protein
MMVLVCLPLYFLGLPRRAFLGGGGEPVRAGIRADDYCAQRHIRSDRNGHRAQCFRYLRVFCRADRTIEDPRRPIYHGDACRAAARVRYLFGRSFGWNAGSVQEQRAGHDVVGGVINCVTVREATIETYIAGVINEPAIRVPLAA